MRSMREIHDALSAERDVLVDELLKQVKSSIPFYAKLSEAQERAGAVQFFEYIIGGLLDDDRGWIQDWVKLVLARRTTQGAALEDMFGVVRITRRLFSRRILADGAQPAALSALERVNEILDDLIGAAPAAFQRRMDEAMQALTEVEERFQNLYMRAPTMMYTVDREGHIKATSYRWLDVLGYTREEVIGRPALEFYVEETRQRLVEECAPRLQKYGLVLDLPAQLVTKEGEIVDVFHSILAVHNAWGELDRYIAVFVDVTEQLRMEKALRESEERWRALVELAPLSMCVQREGVVLWVNDAGVRLVGAASASELLGMNIIDFIHPEDREESRRQVMKSVRTGQRLAPVDWRVVTLHGELLHVQVIAQAILFGGEPATQLALVDVTARLLAEAAQRREDAQAKLIEAQEETLRALSTPLIPLEKGLLVLPLVGRITGDRAKRIVEELASGVVEQQASVVILDVTGVPEADESVAAALARAAQTIRLLGAEVILTGIQPVIARMFVELNVDLGGMTTRGTLRDGIAHALARCDGRRRAWAG
ncbi:PAS domain S-box protein [Chondromyces crocatus]|uniref:Anti-anti-sigma factor n=1 Tax=Chondromyces crocatus TaxID=52 RepID=A0A0K1ET84_CHOCO|nr:PAS domain S-box protein [Chondromyces crocatus]AKT44125.1 uncharacterized protein CMC5_083650 [Chondromyces crocatus]